MVKKIPDEVNEMDGTLRTLADEDYEILSSLLDKMRG